MRFQNGFNKVVIELRVVQYWTYDFKSNSRCVILKSRVWFQTLSHTGQNWDRGYFLLITRALLVIKRAWWLDADWLYAPALSWFPASNRFWIGILETHRSWVWSKRGYFMLAWKKIDMQESAVIFDPKMVLIRSLKKVWLVPAAGVRELHGYKNGR